MIKIPKIIGALALFSAVSSANAMQINFIDLTQNTVTGLGESAWNTLTVSDDGITANITAAAGANPAFAYLDWGNAGLGTCQDVSAGNVDVTRTGMSSNICNPSNDDNTTVGESVQFSFDTDVNATFWFNNNHDGGFGIGDQVNISGTPYDVSTGYVGGLNGIGGFSLAAGEVLTIKYQNEEFYLSGFAARVAPTTIPEPGMLSLLGICLAGMSFIRRRLR